VCPGGIDDSLTIDVVLSALRAGFAGSCPFHLRHSYHNVETIPVYLVSTLQPSRNHIPEWKKCAKFREILRNCSRVSDILSFHRRGRRGGSRTGKSQQ